MASTSSTTSARFEAKIDVSGGPDACHPWTAGRQRDRRGVLLYGVFHPVKGQTVRAHRWALEQSLGRPLHPGMEACHTCDRPECCNLRHLYEGSRQDNVDDCVRRGRNVRGVTVPSAVMTAEGARKFRVRFGAGEPITALTKEFGISLGAGSKIVNGHTWRSAGGPIRTPGHRGRRLSTERTSV